mgnify:FL=1
MASLSRMDGYFVHIASRLESLRQGGKGEETGWLGELKSWSLWRAVAAEFLATMMFVFIGTMAACSMAETPDTSLDAKFIRVRYG